jgi:serum/glucocorticoid-regulated kinase 2
MEGAVNVTSFSLLSVIGKGNYAKVLLVKKKDNNRLFAMKALKKKHVELKRQEVRSLPNYFKEHIMNERNILANSVHPFIVKLFYSF